MLPGVQWKIKEPISIIYILIYLYYIHHQPSMINNQFFILQKTFNKKMEYLHNGQGSLYYIPKQCIIVRETPKFTITLHCLIPPKWVSSNDPQNGTFSVSHNSILNRHELLHIIKTGSSRGNSNPSLFILKVFWATFTMLTTLIW